MSKANVIRTLSWSFVGGVGVASFFDKELINPLFLFCLIMIAFIVSTLGLLSSYRKYILIIAVFGLGLWRFSLCLFPLVTDHISVFNGQSVEVTGNVISFVKEKAQSQEFKIADLEVRGSGDYRVYEGDVLVFGQPYPKVNYGDKLKIACELEAPEPFEGFAYDRYLNAQDIYSVCYYPRFEILAHSQGSKFISYIFSIKKYCLNLVDKGLGEPEAGLLKAVMFGEKQYLGNDLRQDFSRSGLSHIAAISGLHISTLLALIGYILFTIGFSRRQVFPLSVVLITAYIIMIGVPMSALRAGIMGSLVLWAIVSGRISRIDNVLVFTAALLLSINPRLIRDDVGFQLSFLAVLGIAWFYPFLEKIISKYENKIVKYILGAVCLTLAAQIFTWPIISINFGEISLVSPFSNLLVLWTLPFLLLSSIIALVTSAIIPSFVVLAFLPTHIILAYIFDIARLFSNFSFAYWSIFGLPVWLLSIYYALAIIFKARVKSSKINEN